MPTEAVLWTIQSRDQETPKGTDNPGMGAEIQQG